MGIRWIRQSWSMCVRLILRENSRSILDNHSWVRLHRRHIKKGDNNILRNVKLMGRNPQRIKKILTVVKQKKHKITREFIMNWNNKRNRVNSIRIKIRTNRNRSSSMQLQRFNRRKTQIRSSMETQRCNQKIRNKSHNMFLKSNSRNHKQEQKNQR